MLDFIDAGAWLWLCRAAPAPPGQRVAQAGQGCAVMALGVCKPLGFENRIIQAEKALED